MLRRIAPALAALTLSFPALADDGRSGVALDVPLAELPFNARNGGSWPSMQQSLWLSADFYQLLHYGVGQAIDPYEGPGWKRAVAMGTALAVDFLVTPLPPALGWQHEEGHRAVLSGQKIGSRNGIYQFKIFSSTVSVDHVSDEALRDFKARDPAGFVRMATAGLEMNLELATALEKNQVFYGTRAFHGGLLWQTYATNSAYLGACASSDDSAINDAEASEGADVSARDFTGFDCRGWVYDLFRPAEPYDARGAHPSGVGVRRYRRHTDLSADERSYLKQQFYLSFLNFLDPALLSFDWFSFEVGERRKPLRLGGHVRHTPAPYGQAIQLDAFGQYGDFNGLVSLIGGLDKDRFFPGVNAELHRFPLDLVVGLPINLSARVAGWLQPDGLRFSGARYAPGGLASLRVAYSFDQTFEPYVEVEGKSAGWVPGNVWLDSNVSVRAGLVSQLFK